MHPNLRDLAQLHVGELFPAIFNDEKSCGHLLIHTLTGAFQHQHEDDTVGNSVGWKLDGFQLLLGLLLDHIRQISAWRST